MNYKISIVTINLNNAQGLERTIQSVTNQSYISFEFIVVDGNSVDGSKEVIASYKDHIDQYLIEDDNGIYEAMNKGISLARGEYLLFLNSGDALLDKGTLYQASNHFGADLVIGLIETPDGIGKHFYRMSFYEICCFGLPHQSTFIKRQLFDSVGLYDEQFRISSDWQFFMRSIFDEKCSYNRIDLAISYYDNEGISTKFSEISAQEKIQFLNDHYKISKFKYQWKLRQVKLYYRIRFRVLLIINGLFNSGKS